MNTGQLRQLWNLIEETHTHLIHNQNDTDLIQQLIKQLHHRHPLSGEESQVMLNYLKLKLPLIRDMAS